MITVRLSRPHISWFNFFCQFFLSMRGSSLYLSTSGLTLAAERRSTRQRRRSSPPRKSAVRMLLRLRLKNLSSAKLVSVRLGERGGGNTHRRARRRRGGGCGVQGRVTRTCVYHPGDGRRLTGILSSAKRSLAPGPTPRLPSSPLTLSPPASLPAFFFSSCPSPRTIFPQHSLV